jgi:hypothetical protein
MAIIATENQRLSHVLKHEYAPNKAYCREVLTLTFATATTLKIGTLVTATAVATGATAGDVVGIVMEDTVCPATVATKVLTLARGPAEVSNAGLIFADTPTAPQLVTLATTLKAKGIVIAEAV